MAEFLKKHYQLLILIIIASFYYTFRLNHTFVLAGDTARDLMDVMNIWQNKIITVVGEPANTITNNPIQVLFPSLYLYIGLIGLLLTGFNPAGSVLPNIALTLASIPFFYKLSKKYIQNTQTAFISTFTYSISPITVALARSYWEPNIILPLSVFVWYSFLCSKSKYKYIIAGFLSGIVFDIHYMNIISVLPIFIYFLFKKKYKQLLSSILGLIIAVSPIILFELKNSFFITKAFLGSVGGFSTFSNRSINPFLSMDIFLYIFGLGPYQYYIPQLINIGYPTRIVVDSVIGIVFIYTLIKSKDYKDGIFIPLLAGLIVAWYFEQSHTVALRYVLSVFPLFVIGATKIISKISTRFIYLLLIPPVILSTKTITHTLNPQNTDDYYPIAKVEEISEYIISDNPKGKYNVTENILGDARSLAFRFYLTKGTETKPQSVINYAQLDSLYVITPSLDKTYKDNRWEFVASNLNKDVLVKDFGDLKLYKFYK